MQILKDMGVTEYEPRVINQMLEFTYSKSGCLLMKSKLKLFIWSWNITAFIMIDLSMQIFFLIHVLL